MFTEYKGGDTVVISREYLNSDKHRVFTEYKAGDTVMLSREYLNSYKHRVYMR